MGNSSGNLRKKHTSGGAFSPAQCKLILADAEDAKRRGVVLELMVTGAGSPSANGFYRLAEQQVTYEHDGKARQGPQWQQVDSPAWRILVTDVTAEEARAAGAAAAAAAAASTTAGGGRGRGGGGGDGGGGGASEKRPSSMGSMVVWQICKVTMGREQQVYYTTLDAEPSTPKGGYSGGRRPPAFGWQCGGGAGVGRPCPDADSRIEVSNAHGSARNIHLSVDTAAWDKKLSGDSCGGGGFGDRGGDDYAYEYADRDGNVCEAKEPRSA